MAAACRFPQTLIRTAAAKSQMIQSRFAIVTLMPGILQGLDRPHRAGLMALTIMTSSSSHTRLGTGASTGYPPPKT